MADMIRHQILPAVSDYADQLCQRAITRTPWCAHQYETSTAMQIGHPDGRPAGGLRQAGGGSGRHPRGSIKAMNYCHEVLIPDMAEARKPPTSWRR